MALRSLLFGALSLAVFTTAQESVCVPFTTVIPVTITETVGSDSSGTPSSSPTLTTVQTSATVMPTLTAGSATYVLFFTGYGVEESPNNPGNTNPAAPPKTTIISSASMKRDSSNITMEEAAQQCAQDLNNINYGSFDLHYRIAEQYWECIMYAGPNMNSSTFNQNNSDISYVMGYSVPESTSGSSSVGAPMPTGSGSGSIGSVPPTNPAGAGGGSTSSMFSPVISPSLSGAPAPSSGSGMATSSNTWSSSSTTTSSMTTSVAGAAYVTEPTTVYAHTSTVQCTTCGTVTTGATVYASTSTSTTSVTETATVTSGTSTVVATATASPAAVGRRGLRYHPNGDLKEEQ